MQIKALVGLRVGGISIRRGGIADIVDHRAQQLIKRGLCVPVHASQPLDHDGDGKKGGVKPRGKKGAAGKASPRPSKKDQTGGQTGVANSSSSSQEAPASETSPSTPSEGADA